MKHNKLVRDKIPEIIFKAGQTPATHIATKKEYWEKLKQKLQEEVDEFFESESKGELVDILEVVYTLADYKQVNRQSLESLRLKTAQKKGGYKKKIILDEIK
jgi:predicted house-cleaning noncanonical NTP pyrophosphatase (MazG superfamily)